MVDILQTIHRSWFFTLIALVGYTVLKIPLWVARRMIVRISPAGSDTFLASCTSLSLEEKSRQITVGMNIETVLSTMGRYPNDRRFEDSDEAWHYCGFKPWSVEKYLVVILFRDNLVIAIGDEDLADSDDVCSELGSLGPGDYPTPATGRDTDQQIR